MARVGDWNLWKHGAMPATNDACPMFMKALLIFAYRLRVVHVEPSAAQKGVIVVFLPLMAVVGIWLASCIPSIVTRTRSRIATITHIVFGIYLTVTYWILICVTLAYAKQLSLLTGVTAAMHFAWFCCPAHPDAIHGSKSVMHCMFWAQIGILYYTYSCIPNSPVISDKFFVLVIWAPEIVNMLITPVFNHCVTFAVSVHHSASVADEYESEDSKTD
jgi:hypothetical protein